MNKAIEACIHELHEVAHGLQQERDALEIRMVATHANAMLKEELWVIAGRIQEVNFWMGWIEQYIHHLEERWKE